MPKKIRLPDNSIVKFPESMSDNEIENQLNIYYLSKNNPDINNNSDLVSNFLKSTKSVNDLSMMKQGLNTPEKFGKAALEAGGGLASAYQPELIAAKGLIPYLSNAAGRIGSGVASSTAMQMGREDNKESLPESLENNLKFNSILEAATSPLHAISGIAEMIKPLKYTNEKLNDIKSNYQNVVDKERKQYQPVMEKYGDENLNSDKYIKMYDKYKDYVGQKVKFLHEKFIENPTIKNAHKLQSQMFSEMIPLYKNKSLDAIGQDRLFALEKSRESLKNDILNSLESHDKDAKNSYLEGARIHKQERMPYLSSPKLANIVEGNVEEIEPNKLINAIKSSKEKKNIPNEHFLSNTLNDIKNKVSMGKAMQYGLPIAASTVGGHMINPILGTLGGIGAGTYLGQHAMPQLVKMAQNPWIIKQLQKASPGYYSAGRQLIGNNDLNQ